MFFHIAPLLIGLMKLFIITLLFCTLAQAQNLYKDCPPGGDAKTMAIRKIDTLKNKNMFPVSTKKITFSTMSRYKFHQVISSDAVEVTAYVFNVTPGGVESCNCHMRDQEDRDTHITLTPDAKHTTAKYRIIAEVTPRFRAMMKAKGIDWSTSNLKKMLIHKKIKISGWLFADTEHTNATEADRPGALHNWRASILEVHPVTMIEVVK